MANIADQIKVKQDTDGMLHRALERIIQLYTDKSHFVYELLQNAEDCEATQIKFVQHDRYLEVMHNGKPFTEANLAGLCDIGKSDKADNLNQIGEFGVGFKSVYGICDTVRLFSNPANYHGRDPVDAIKFAVQIDGFISPHDIEYEEIPESYTTRFVFLYSVGRNYSGFSSLGELLSALARKLSDLGITTLLFMKNLELIEYEINTTDIHSRGQYSLEKKAVNDHCLLVSASGSSDKEKEDEKLYFMKFSRKIDSFGRTVDIAFPVRKNSKDKGLVFEKSKNPYVSVYFPTETESKLDFIVQGPFRTTPNRTSIPSDDKDNIRLADETALLLKESVFELRDREVLNLSLLKILPLDSSLFENSPLFLPLSLAAKELLINHRTLPCGDSNYTKKAFARLARQEKLIDLLPDPVLSELIGDGNNYHWLPSVLTETNREFNRVYKFITGPEMKVPAIRPEDLRILISANEHFLPTRSDKWLVKLYSMLENVSSAFSKTKNESNMLTCSFIKTSNGEFVAPYRRIDKQYIPNVFLPSTKVHSDSINYVDDYVYTQCKDFFEIVLGLTTPDEYEFFVLDFKNRYSGKRKINDNQHIKDIFKLIKYLNKADHSDEVETLISDYLYLKCDDGVYRRPGSVPVYIPETSDGLQIKQYYKGISNNRFFVDKQFYESNEISEDDLLQLNVKNSLIVSSTIMSGLYNDGSRSYSPTWSTIGSFRWKLSIDLLKEALLYISKHPNAQDSVFKSQSILKELLNNDMKLQGNVYIGGNTPNLRDETSEAIRILKGDGFKEWDGRWIYMESMELVSPRKISKYDIPTMFYGNIKPDSVLYELLGFKKTEIDDIENIRQNYTQEQRDAFFESELRLRYGMSTADLEKGVSFSGINQSGVDEEDLPFPTANLMNWDSLKKHAAEMLVYANPVTYAKVLRSIRISVKYNESRSYLMGMYRYTGTHKFACQMCHKPVTDIKAAEIFLKPENELDPVNLCLCPNCASVYSRFRNEEPLMRQLKETILSIREDAITDEDIVVIPIEDREIWFTQTHFAEIQTLIKLEKQAKEEKTNTSKPKEPEENATSEEDSKLMDYSEFIGKKITRTRDGMKGRILSIDGEYVNIDVYSGPKAGETIQLLVDCFLDVSGNYIIEQS